MKPVSPDNLFQNTFFPQPGITVRYLKISGIMDVIFTTGPDPDYKTMPNQCFGTNSFKIPFLSDKELATVNTFKAQKKQVEWICGRFSLKTLASEIIAPGVPLAEIHVSYEKKGAPFLNQYPDISISLSHSGDYTAVGLGQDRQATMGIDIEQIQKMPDIFFMKTAFTEREIHHMPQTPHALFRHWTLKEAFLKYIKMGFNENLHRVEIIEDEIFFHGKKQDINAWSRTIEDQYILSIVADLPPKPDPDTP
jgi:4'-phosphopantetheinyl transferase